MADQPWISSLNTGLFFDPFLDSFDTHKTLWCLVGVNAARPCHASG